MNTLCEPELVLAGDAPLAWQIRDQLRAQIKAGLLRPGEQLPTVRAIAVQLAVNPNLVSRAYADLSRDGFVTSEDGSGVYVAPAEQLRQVIAERRAALEQLCEQFLAHARDQGFPPADVLRAAEALVQRRDES
jgi:GntR family transcriptional regulator